MLHLYGNDQYNPANVSGRLGRIVRECYGASRQQAAALAQGMQQHGSVAAAAVVTCGGVAYLPLYSGAHCGRAVNCQAHPHGSRPSYSIAEPSTQE